MVRSEPGKYSAVPFDRTKADRALSFFYYVLKYSTDEWYGKPFLLTPWEYDCIEHVFGNVDDEGRRITQTVYLEVPKKSGKSEFAGGLALYILSDNEFPGCQVYGVAAATRQALNVYRAACKMVDQSPELTEMFRILRSTNRILKRDDPDTFYSAVAADGDLGDGVNPACVIADEVHRYSTRKQLENWDVLSNGGITRRQSLTIAITTAGVRNKSPIAWKLHEKTQKIQEGIINDPRFYGRIYGAHPDDDPSDEKTWIKANPSLEENGGFVKLEKIREKFIEHKTGGTLQTFRRYFLNMWDQDERKAIDMREWDRCPLDWVAQGLLPKAPEDTVRPLPHALLRHFMDPKTLAGRRCWAGVDLSMTTDLSAVTLVFPRDDIGDEGGFDFLPFFYLPSRGLKEAEVRDGMPYTDWVEQGFLEISDITEDATAGVVDYGELQKRLVWASHMFDLQEMCFDPWNSRQISAKLLQEGFNPIEVPQQYAHLSEASKKFLEIVVSSKLHHGGHPVLRWNASCLTYKECNDNIRFVKPERLKTSSRIDGISAGVNALVRAIVSIKSDQGIEVW